MVELNQEHIDQATAPYTWPHFIIQERFNRMGIKFNLVDKFSAVVAKAKIGHVGHIGASLGGTFAHCMDISKKAADAAGKTVLIIGHGSEFSVSDINQAAERLCNTPFSDSFKDHLKEMAIELDKMQMDCRVVDEVDIQNKEEQKAVRKVKQHQKPQKKVNYNNKYNAHKQHRLIVRRR